MSKTKEVFTAPLYETIHTVIIDECYQADLRPSVAHQIADNSSAKIMRLVSKKKQWKEK